VSPFVEHRESTARFSVLAVEDDSWNAVREGEAAYLVGRHRELKDENT